MCAQLNYYLDDGHEDDYQHYYYDDDYDDGPLISFSYCHDDNNHSLISSFISCLSLPLMSGQERKGVAETSKDITAGNPQSK